MGLFKKIFTAVRGGAREVGEAIVDVNSIRILEQEIKDADGHVAKAKQDLTAVIAKEMQTNRELNRLQKDMTQYEDYALQALNKGDDTLATEIAGKIADIETELMTQQTAKASFSGHANRLRELVKKTERQLGEHKRQLVMVKTTESVHKATSAISDNFANSNSKLLSATESLARIKQKQQDYDDRLQAAEALENENSGASLEAKMRAAGIGQSSSSTSSILDRLKAKQNQ